MDHEWREVEQGDLSQVVEELPRVSAGDGDHEGKYEITINYGW